jgi:hypothetical protein
MQISPFSFFIPSLSFFSDFRPTSLEKGQELFRLRMYEVYAWGCSLVIASVAAILDFLPVTPDDKFLRPNFGKNHCWFFGKLIFLATDGAETNDKLTFLSHSQFLLLDKESC